MISLNSFSFRRLGAVKWKSRGNQAHLGGDTISIEASAPIKRMEMLVGKESRCYMRMTETPMLAVELADAGNVTTRYEWKS